MRSTFLFSASLIGEGNIIQGKIIGGNISGLYIYMSDSHRILDEDLCDQQRQRVVPHQGSALQSVHSHNSVRSEQRQFHLAFRQSQILLPVRSAAIAEREHSQIADHLHRFGGRGAEGLPR